MGRTDRLGKFIKLRDVYGNTYTYAHLKKLVARLPGAQGEDGLRARRSTRSCTSRRRRRTRSRPRPPAPARRSSQGARRRAGRRRRHAGRAPRRSTRRPPRSARSACSPTRSRPGAYNAGGEEQLLNAGSVIPGYTTFKSYFTGVYGLKRYDVVLKKLKPG